MSNYQDKSNDLRSQLDLGRSDTLFCDKPLLDATIDAFITKYNRGSRFSSIEDLQEQINILFDGLKLKTKLRKTSLLI